MGLHRSHGRPRQPCSVLFPIISKGVVVPYIGYVLASHSTGFYAQAIAAISADNLWLVAILALFTAVVMLGLPKAGSNDELDVYLAGANVDNDGRLFKNSFGQPMAYTQRNWYLEGFFGEARLDKPTVAISLAVFVFGIFAAMLIGGGF